MSTTSKKSLDGLELDAAVIGSGVGGLYALYRLRDEMGLNAQGFDDASGVGGTWYWNRYPGCRVDTEATVYCYSFDREILKNWTWTERYPRQPEILAYLNHVADRHDLKRSINFETRIVRAEWDEAAARWRLQTAKGERITAQYVIEGVGLLSSTNYPRYAGADRFKGQVFHAARWPKEGVDLRGKKVGVMGTGSTGIQIISEIAPIVEHLYVLQRTPQYVVPLGTQHPLPANVQRMMKEDPDGFVHWALDTAAVFGFKESTTPAMSVPPGRRQRVYEDAWERGNGFSFMLETFSDIIVSKEANDTATDFVRSKIKEIVKDPKLAAKLMPHDLYAKRPLAVDHYYEVYNRKNVTLVDIKENPIQEISDKGVRTTAGEIELDVLVYATGFDAVTGNYLKIETIGRNGVRLKDKWSNGPIAYLGLTIADFPNLFMIFGPFGPFTSQPLVHEYQVNWFTDLIKHARAKGLRSIDVDPNAEQAWVKLCNDGANQTLFPQCDSWINGSNVPGKPKASMFYMGGMANYNVEMSRISGNGYREFKLGR